MHLLRPCEDILGRDLWESRSKSPDFLVSRSLRAICRSLREALQRPFCQHAHQLSGDPGGPRVLPHGASSKGDATASQSPEMRLCAFHDPRVRSCVMIVEGPRSSNCFWIHVAGAIFFMVQVVLPPGVLEIAVTVLGPINCLQSQRTGGILFAREMASRPWLDMKAFMWRR